MGLPAYVMSKYTWDTYINQFFSAHYSKWESTEGTYQTYHRWPITGLVFYFLGKTYTDCFQISYLSVTLPLFCKTWLELLSQTWHGCIRSKQVQVVELSNLHLLEISMCNVSYRKSHQRVLELQLICLCSEAANLRPAVLDACGHLCMTLVGEAILPVLNAWFIQHIKVWCCGQLTGLRQNSGLGLGPISYAFVFFSAISFYLFVG